MEEDTGAQLRRTLTQRLESLRRAGLTHLPRCEPTVEPPPAEVHRPAPQAGDDDSADVSRGGRRSGSLFEEMDEAPAEKVTVAQNEPSTLSLSERQEQLATLSQKVAACVRCRELAETRTQTVFGVGNPQARIMFVGEAPGADEDRQGEPFVGRAGQLLDKIIVACKLTREEVYIGNILKCRPPGNRNPTPEEAANCREHLDGQIALVDPDYIVCLGSVAAQNLLDVTTSIGRMRQKFFTHGRAKVLCTYHPSYLLRNPAIKKDVWEDMKLLMREVGIELD